MGFKWIGAVLIVVACGGFGCSIAAGVKKEERELTRLVRLLGFMENQLQYRLTPLPELCRQAGKETPGSVGEVFSNLSRELLWQSAPDAAGCMAAAVRRSHDLSPALRQLLLALGQTLGRFDLDGQLKGLEEAREGCRSRLEALARDRDSRLRSYRTLGLCAGAALAILLL